MKLKLDEKGNVVLENGLPVWIADDGKEIPYDVPALVTKLSAVNAESAGRRKEIDELAAKLKAFEGVDPAKYKELSEKAADLDAGKLIDAGKVEEVKKQIAASFEAKIADLEKARLNESESAKKTLQDKDAAIRPGRRGIIWRQSLGQRQTEKSRGMQDG
ncbi:MAG: hypothetical protein LBB66_01275 [Desulfovibrio sp.]|jgi:hypothetical protein|nr:hypothetical protein [Desulfovibrio sp.]